MAEPPIFDLFAGAGGWEEGLRALGSRSGSCFVSLFDRLFACRFDRLFAIDCRRNCAIPHGAADCGASILPTSSRSTEVGL
jgi:hypothetical protein